MSQELISIVNQISSLLDNLKKKLEADLPAIPDSIYEEQENKTCHFCKHPILKGETVIRGIHERCYKVVKRTILAGQINEMHLMTNGLLAPKKLPGRKAVQNEILDRLIEENARAKMEVKVEAPKKKGRRS